MVPVTFLMSSKRKDDFIMTMEDADIDSGESSGDDLGDKMDFTFDVCHPDRISPS